MPTRSKSSKVASRLLSDNKFAENQVIDEVEDKGTSRMETIEVQESDLSNPEAFGSLTIESSRLVASASR